MGLQESESAPGWYNGYSYEILKQSDYDAGRERARKSRRTSAIDWKRFAAIRATQCVLRQKTLSQWDEPSFESLWVSRVKKHSIPLSESVSNIYDSRTDGFLKSWFNQYVQIFYAAFVAGAVFAVKKRPEGFVVLPLIVLGGFLYHLLFEAKSQYIISICQ